MTQGVSCLSHPAPNDLPFHPTFGHEPLGEYRKPLDFPHLQCCHHALVFDKLTVCNSPNEQGVVCPKGSDTRKFQSFTYPREESKPQFGGTPTSGKIPTCGPPATDCCLLLRHDQEIFFAKVARPKPIEKLIHPIE